MIIIDTKTEMLFLQHIERLKPTAYNWRVLHLHFSVMPHIDKIETVRTIIGIVGGRDHHAYLCADGDMFLLAAGITSRDVQHAAANLQTIMQAILINPMVDYYELESNWGRLAYIVEEKQLLVVKQQQVASKAMAAARLAKAKEAILNLPLDAHLILTIGQRRARYSYNTILVVEDEPFSGRLVENALRRDQQVNLVNDGQNAIFSYVRDAPHVVFLDIDLPDISGLEVLKKIMELDKQAYCVMLSGNADKSNILQAMELGAKGFVGKPFTKEKLCQYIARCPTTPQTIGGLK